MVVLTVAEKKLKKATKKANKKAAAALKKKDLQYSKIYREIKYGQLTYQKHEKSWRKMLFRVAMPKMRADLEFAWHNFERTIDSKDFTISLLMDELRASEEQYMRSQRSHMDNIDDLIVLCHDQIADLRQTSQKVIENLYKTATFERTDVTNVTKENEEYLRTMLFMLQHQKKESEKLLRGEYLSKQEVEISRLQEYCNKFTEELEGKFEKMWDDSIECLKDHITSCYHRRKRYYELSCQDEVMQNVIRSLWAKIKRYLDAIKLIKVKFSEYCYDENKKITHLTGEFKHFDYINRLIKQRVEEERLMDEHNLQILTLESYNKIIKRLEVDEKRGERLLKISAICRKFETDQELTLPFPKYDDEYVVKSIPIKVKCHECMPEMDLFWNRCAQADDLRYKVNEQKVYLQMKNDRLKQRLHEYCQCLSCTENINVSQRARANVGIRFA